MSVRSLVKYGLQPALMIGWVAAWLADPSNGMTYLACVLFLQLVLGTLEYWIPARPEWRQPWQEKTQLVIVAVLVTIFIVMVGEWYASWMAPLLNDMRASLGLDVWPHHWPMVVQLLMVFFMSEFIWYWFHRAEHRWSVVWRVSGHGAHHAFKRLNAINYGANHPFEAFVLVLPTLLVELTFGAGTAAAGAGMLAAVQVAVVHSNLDLNSKYMDWLFTTNRAHIRHHSAVLEESNTNYGCAALIWDRLFGTYGDSQVVEAGIGPTEPTLWQKFLMPFKEPNDSQVAP